MEYGCVYSFVGRRSTTAETTTAATAHLEVMTYFFFFTYSYSLLFWGFCTTTSTTMLIKEASYTQTCSAEVTVLHTPVESGFAWPVVLYMGKANEATYIYRRSSRSLSLMSSCLTVSFSCVVYSRGNRTPESEKKKTSVYLIKRKTKNIILYTYHVRISHFVVALAAGVNSTPSGRQKKIFRKVTNHRWGEKLGVTKKKTIHTTAF